MTPQSAISWRAWAGTAVVAALVFWSYAPTFRELGRRWHNDPQYTHGYLVPVLSAGLLWWRRDRLDPAALRPSWWGLLPISAAAGMRFVSANIANDWLDAVSLLPCLAGLSVLMGGRAAWRWTWPAIVYLFFMIPLPFQVEIALAGPLQRLVTRASAFTLQLMGLPALPEGNRIYLDRDVIEVVTACNGLGMLVSFVALAAAVALVVDRPIGDRLILLASAVPIALFANVVRLAVTGALFGVAGSGMVRALLHDLAGWVMMPLALALLAAELRLLPRLLVEGEDIG